MAIQLHNRNQRGVTLIELLVVVAIISVLTAVMIPRLRMINKDRNIREAARIVGSVFANASQRAIADGGSGILLERNPNFTDATTGANFACTTLYTLRSLPPYIGDDDTANATITGGVVTIDPAPVEHTPMDPVVEANDYISLNFSSTRYRISGVSADGSSLTLDGSQFGSGGGYLPLPTDVGAPGVDFVIYRQPRKLESSRVELPDGYLVDLRYTGPTLPGDSAPIGSACNQSIDPAFTDQATANEIKVIIDGDGAIDWVYFYDNGTTLFSTPTLAPGAIVGVRPRAPLYLFVSAYEIDETIMPIERASNLWVTVNQATGGVNVGYSVPPTGLLDMDDDDVVGTLADKILEARGIASKQQSANQ